MKIDPYKYNAKYEQKYFYLPRIIRKGNNSYKDLYKNKSVRIITQFNLNKIERLFIRHNNSKRRKNSPKSKRAQ